MTDPAPTSPGVAAAARPPAWLILSTIGLAIACLVMAVTETTLWKHYLIDQGEAISVVGLLFITVAGLHLYRQRRLRPSLPFVFPWLLYPVITQGDQIIDNLSINPMRVICHVLLGALFGLPVGVIVLAVRHVLAPVEGGTRAPRRWAAILPGLPQIMEGRVREGAGLLAAALLILEVWVANQFLGSLMVITLIIMVFGVLVYVSAADRREARVARRANSERFALAVLFAGVVISGGLYVGYKNRPGAYQGSPSFVYDPSQKAAGYAMDRIPAPAASAVAPPAAAAGLTREALAEYGRSLEKLVSGLYVLDRNYTYDFHNALFLRYTPLIPSYRAVGLQRIAEATAIATGAAPRGADARAALSDGDPLTLLLDEARGFVGFVFDREPLLARLSAEFERTPAGLQHAAHLYEGEGKMIDLRVVDILNKHRATIESPAVAPIVNDFASSCRAVHALYANRVVGF